MEGVNHMAIVHDRFYSLTRDRIEAYGRAIVAYSARKAIGTLVMDIARRFERETLTIREAVIKMESLWKGYGINQKNRAYEKQSDMRRVITQPGVCRIGEPGDRDCLLRKLPTK
jgi:hypothetical protein